MDDYTFGDSDRAAARLERLATVFEAPSRAFLQEVTPDACDTVVDLGCGPGASTLLLAEVTDAHTVVGLDQSDAFVAAANRRLSHDLPGRGHTARVDVTAEADWPVNNVDLVWGRFLFAHLPHPNQVAASVLGRIRRGGVLAADELESIETDDPVFTDYLAITTALVASRGATMAAGPVLATAADPPAGPRVHDEVVSHEVTAADAAAMFLPNLRTWRHDPMVRRDHGPSALAELESALVERLDATSTVTWRLRHIAWQRRI